MAIPPPGVLQTASAQAGSVASLTTTAITTTAGNLLVVCVNTFDSGRIGATPITDSKSNTWVQAIAPFGVSSGFSAMYYCASCLGGASHTFTFTPSSSDACEITVYEITGATASPLNGTSTSSASTASHNSGSITSGSTGPEAFIGYCAVSHASESPFTQPSTFWVTSASLADGTPQGVFTGFRIVGASTTDSFLATFANPFNEACMVAGFKLTATSGGGGGGSFTFFGGQA